MPSWVRWDTVAILGVGLIGGSIARALRQSGLAHRLIGVTTRDPRELQSHGIVDEATNSIEHAAREAQVVVVCAPVDRIARLVVTAAAVAPADALITDAGSTKSQIVADVESDGSARARFVGAHPIAGSEQKGPGAAHAGLFQDRACILTPTARTPAERLEDAREFWQSLGCRLVELSPESHDAHLASTSHLPHLVAAALALAVPPAELDLAAGAYRDGTRVALSDPAMWVPIFLQNREALLASLEPFEAKLSRLRAAIASMDESQLHELWCEAREARRHYREPEPAARNCSPVELQVSPRKDDLT